MSGSKKTCKNPSKLFKNQHGNQTSQVPSSFCRSDLCPKQSWVKDLVRPDGLFAMPLHGGWLNGPWVLESSMWYISSDSVFLPHRSEFCWILTKKPEFSRMSHMNQLGFWRSGCGLWFGQSWDHWDHQAAASVRCPEGFCCTGSSDVSYTVAVFQTFAITPTFRSLRANDARKKETFSFDTVLPSSVGRPLHAEGARQDSNLLGIAVPMSNPEAVRIVKSVHCIYCTISFTILETLLSDLLLIQNRLRLDKQRCTIWLVVHTAGLVCGCLCYNIAEVSRNDTLLRHGHDMRYATGPAKLPAYTWTCWTSGLHENYCVNV